MFESLRALGFQCTTKPSFLEIDYKCSVVHNQGHSHLVVVCVKTETSIRYVILEIYINVKVT